MKKRWIAASVVAGLWVGNSSLLVGPVPDALTRVIAHRGAHQTFSSADLDNDDCTATRIGPITHPFIENTLPSMKAAFDASADVVELDVHLTPDGKFAVMHDWTLDCRTNGKGVTEATEMSILKTLDVGFGYTADGGKTFPLRGKGIGMMPELDDVFATFPDQKFFLNFKSRRAEEGSALALLVTKNPAYRDQIFGVYGGLEPTRAAIAAIPEMRGYDKKSLKSCLGTYLAIGWSGYVPQSCRNTIVNIPRNLAFLFWGWPHRLTKRLSVHNTIVILSGDYAGGEFSTGVDTPGQVASIPNKFDGYIWTNRILETGQVMPRK